MSAAGTMVDLSFHLTFNGVVTELEYAPDGWNSEAVKWSRDMRYMGMFRNFTDTLLFVKDGAQILRNAFYTLSVNADVLLEVRKRNQQTNIFETKYTGKVDFATFKDTYDSVEVSCIEGGLSADVVKYDTTKYDIPFPAGHRTQVYWEGQISNFETFNWVSVYNDTEISMVTPGVDPVWIVYKFDDNNFKDINGGSISCANYKTTPGYDWQIEVLRDCDMVITMNPNGRSYDIMNLESTARAYRIQERIVVDRGGTESYYNTLDENYLVSDQNNWNSFYPTSTEILFPATDTYHFLAGDKITFQYKVAQLGTFQYGYKFRLINYSAYQMKVAIYDRMPNGNFAAWKAIDLFAAIADKIGGYPVKSDFLTTLGTLILPATGVRERLNPTFITTYTSLADFYESINATEEIGMGVEVINGVDTLVIEELDYFLSNSVAYDLGNITDFSLTIQEDIIPSEINIGFNYEPNDDYYGRLEYNGNATFITPSKANKVVKQYLSVYRADILGVDRMRVRSLLETSNSSTEVSTKDTSSDKLNWILDCKYLSSDVDYDYYELNRDYDITGVYWPESQANVRFTPKRCLLRKKVMLSSVFQLLTGVFTFASGSKNFWISTKYTTESTYLFERYPFDIPTTDKTFYPFAITCNAACKFELIDGADADPYGLVKFTYKGNIYYGYIMDISAKIAGDESGQVTLLLSNYGNILQNLI